MEKKNTFFFCISLDFSYLCSVFPREERKKMKRLKRKHYVIAAVMLLLVAGGVVALTIYRELYATFTSTTATQFVYIDSDDSADSVYAKLHPIATDNGLAGLKKLAAHYDYDSRVRTGRYAIEPGQRAIDVFRMLRNGQQTPVMLTIPEVRTMDRMAGRIAQKLMLDSADIANALYSQDFCRGWGYDTTTIACLFVPNTYEVYWNTSLEGLMERMAKEHDRFWNDERKAKAEAQGLTPNEVVTLASIVDEETSYGPEKATIAGLYLNRLHRGMLLQADPTVKYAVGDFTLRRILNRHLEVESPYNTYKHAGLPPGPIRVPSVQAVDAVLNPDETDCLYMCAKEDFSGTHNFARTAAEHAQNARRYQQALNARGIR